MTANSRDKDSSAHNTLTSPKRELTIVRIFNAPRELVFKAWADPRHLMKWWGPGIILLPIWKWIFVPAVFGAAV